MKNTYYLNVVIYALMLCLPFQRFIYSKAQQNSRIAILSLYNEGYKHIGQYSDENKYKYAKKHGYDVFIYHDVLDATRPPAWSKILAIQKHLSDYDWIYWSDADSLIMNTDIKLESYIDDNFDIIISKECFWGFLNTGSFLIKKTDWSFELLKRIYAQTQFISHPLWEQQALSHLLSVDPRLYSHLKILHQRSLNSNFDYTTALDGWYKEGDFVVHFFGPCDKANLMKTWSKKVIY